jgi:hypothetical protein
LTLRKVLDQRASSTVPSAAEVWKLQQDDTTPDVLWKQMKLGGKVYRVNNQRLADLRKRIDRLNRKARRLGAQPIQLRVTAERDQEVIHADDGDRVNDMTYVVLGGSGPVIPGYVFLAALDHGNDSDTGDDAVAIREVPRFGLLDDLDEATVEKLKGVDFNQFRHTENRCDHCGYKRRRNTTYLLLDKNTGGIVQVGSDCLKDFTGAENPEAAAKWAEMLAALDSDMEQEARELHEGSRPAIRTIDYLAHAAACMRVNGWRRRWSNGIRQHGTADEAHDNYQNGFIEVTDEDRQLAEEALRWAREELPEKENLSDFDYSLMAYAASDYLGEKGDGTLAFLPEAYRRHRDRDHDRAEAARSDHVGQPKQRLKGLKLLVKSVSCTEGRYGFTYVTRMVDENGNHFLWFANRELKPGKRYTLSGTVKRHEQDRRTGAKTTVLTNCRSITPAEDDS